MDESEFIQDIVDQILSKLRKSTNRFSSLAREFVGMDSRLEKMMSCLDLGQSNDVRIIGICGMGGIGKTTIARVVYGKISRQFEGSSFLSNVREANEKHGLPHLQTQLLRETLMDRNITVWDVYGGMEEIRNRLCSRRVLIILDDVDQEEQLQSLAGTRDWFGSGSRIIITTRDEHVLICHRAEEIYRVETVDHDEAIQLLRSKAFQNGCPAEDYLQLCEHVVNYANGLPLAIDILGSFLCGRSIDEWKSALHRLKEIPPQKILDKLQISFDGLEKMEQTIFLDIACFFTGEDYNMTRRILKSCGLYPNIGIRALIDKSLLTISASKVQMHDLLKEMGREIVRRESYEEPGKRSRLWLRKDVYHVLKNNTGMEQVEGIVLPPFGGAGIQLSGKPFSKMRKLRLLKLQNLHLSCDLEYFFSELRYLQWHRYPFKFLPSTFQLDKLVELHLQESNIEQFWKKIKPLEMLKVINLSQSRNLIKVTGFSDTPNLKRLILEGCTRLTEVDESIGVLKKLVLLNLKDCKSLMRLPSSICDLKSLKVLKLDGCSKLDKLPERFGDLPCLEELYASGIAKRQLVSAKPWDCLFSLLSSWNPDPVALMLPSLSCLCSLRELDLSECNLMEGAIPNDLGGFPSLQILNLGGNDFVSIPTSIGRLSKLEKLCFANCRMLQSLPELPSNIICLRVDGCESLESFPNPIQKRTLAPWMFTFVNCSKLTAIQGAFAWLKSYFFFLLQCRRQGFVYMDYDFTMCLPGSGLPGCFKNQEIGHSLKFHLPEDWCNDEWMGFFVCAVFGVNEPSLGDFEIDCDLAGGPTPNQVIFWDSVSTQIFIDMNITLDHLWLIFIPRDNLKSLDWWNSCRHFRASFACDGLEVKQCGIRVVYEQDIEELIHWNISSNNLGLPCHQSDCNQGNKQILDDYCCDNEMQSSENDNVFNKLCEETLTMPGDPYLQMCNVVDWVKFCDVREF